MSVEMNNELYHYGVKNMHWGVRRWQNEDGSYKPGGAEHYYTPKSSRDSKKIKKAVDKHLSAFTANNSQHNWEKGTKKIEKIAYKNLKDKDVSKAIDLYNKKKQAEEAVIKMEDKLEEKHGWVDREDPKYEKAFQKELEATEQYADECRKIAKQLLGKYGDKTVNNIKSEYLSYANYAKSGVDRAIQKIGKQRI